MSRVNRGESVLNRLVRSGKISKAGMAAYLAAVDPFHDKLIEGIEGWPDLNSSESVTRIIKSSYPIKAIEDGGSIVIVTYPILNNRVLNSTTRRNAVIDTISDGVSTNSTLSLVVIYNYTKAQTDSGAYPLTAATSPVAAFFDIPGTYAQAGPSRLTGLGVEVHDVSAEIYKQGTISVCEYPQATYTKEAVNVRAQTVGTVTYVQTAAEVTQLMRFPNSLATLMTFPNAVQWEAKDGCYAVTTFTDAENDPLIPEYRVPELAVVIGNQTDSTTSLNNTTRMLGTFATGSVNGDNFVFQPNLYAPINSKCIMLTGLSANSTFTINVKAYLETFPIAGSNLITLATPSAKYDPAALVLISAAMKKLPCAVPVRDNPDGEWFWDTLQSALPYIGGIGSAMFPEFSPLIAAATMAGDTALVNRKKKVEAKKKKAQATAKETAVKKK